MEHRLRAVFILILHFTHFKIFSIPNFYPKSIIHARIKGAVNFVCRKMPRKVFDCTKCGGVHERPINSKCKVVTEMGTASSNENITNVPDSNALILQELKNFSSRMTVMEQKVNDRDSCMASPSVRSSVSNPQEEDDEYVLPSISTLKQSK